MSNFYDVDIERIQSDDTTKTFSVRVLFDGTNLTVSDIRTDDDGNKTAVPFMVQPWKCLPDGSREPFANHDDAFAWFEDSGQRYINS